MTKKQFFILIALVLLIPAMLFSQSGSSRGGTTPSAYQLQVQSNVNGADVFVNGSVRGQTPLRINLAPGTYTIKVARRGYNDWEQVINLNQNLSIQANLGQAVPVYSLQVQSNVPSAQIFVNETQAGQGRSNQNLQAGNYSIRVTAPGYNEFTQNVRLNQNLSVQANLTPVIPSYNLQIRVSIPIAQIFINGNQIGQGQATQTLQAGNYQVTVQAPGYQTYETVVNLDRNQVLNAQLTMATGTVNIIIPNEVLDLRTGNPAAQVKTYVDGSPMNGTAFQLMPGNHLILITSGGLAVQKMVNVLPGQTYNIQLAMDLTVNGQ